MKTTIELRREVAGLIKDRAGMKPTSKEFKALQKQIDHLRECILYLDTKPSIEFLEREVKRIEAQIIYRMGKFDVWLSQQHFKVQAAKPSAKKTFEKHAGISKLREYLKTLEFLLDR